MGEYLWTGVDYLYSIYSSPCVIKYRNKMPLALAPAGPNWPKLCSLKQKKALVLTEYPCIVCEWWSGASVQPRLSISNLVAVQLQSRSVHWVLTNCCINIRQRLGTPKSIWKHLYLTCEDIAPLKFMTSYSLAHLSYRDWPTLLKRNLLPCETTLVFSKYD